MLKLKIAIALIVVALIVAVFLQNSEPVHFKFLFFDTIEVPKTILIAGSALAGALATLIVQFVWRRRRRNEHALPLPGAS